jgi:membrane-bound metal-dependent hydrolase YbcI (DUF457 family)
LSDVWRPSPILLLCIGLGGWLGAELVQSRLPASTAFALVDEIAHASVALLCAIPLVPRWGYRPLLVAVLAGTLIDVDHAIAARSLDPMRMMQLGARPPTHSLAGAVLLATLVGAVLDGRAAYAVFVGVVSHIVRDADGPPGVPLFAPFSTMAHVILPVWVLPLCMLVLAAVGVLLTRMPRFNDDPIAAPRAG